MADWQKGKFRESKKTSASLPFCTIGLWRYSRHPNYFGEILAWTGLWMFSLRTCPKYYGSLAIFSPLLTFLLLVYVSGMPLAEATEAKRHRRLVAFNQYRLITSPLVLLPPRLYAKMSAWIKWWFFFERYTPIVQRPIIKRRSRRTSVEGTGDSDAGTVPSPVSTSTSINNASILHGASAGGAVVARHTTAERTFETSTSGFLLQQQQSRFYSTSSSELNSSPFAVRTSTADKKPSSPTAK